MADKTERHGAFTTTTMVGLDHRLRVDAYRDADGEVTLTVETEAYSEAGSGSVRLLFYGTGADVQRFVREVTDAAAKALAGTADCGWHDSDRDDDHDGLCGWCGKPKLRPVPS